MIYFTFFHFVFLFWRASHIPNSTSQSNKAWKISIQYLLKNKRVKSKGKKNEKPYIIKNRKAKTTISPLKQQFPLKLAYLDSSFSR